MKTSDRISITGPYPGGTYRIPLKHASLWYAKKVANKDDRKDLSLSKIEEVLHQAVQKTMGQTVDHTALDHALNLDCFVNAEAEMVFDKLSSLVALEVLNYFPKLGGELPESFYNLIDLDLYIHVPSQYEEQQGYFFWNVPVRLWRNIQRAW